MSEIGRALVIGGGIGGMAAAIALRQREIDADLISIDPEWKVYGAGITITGPTLRALRDLGILDAIREQGFFATGQRLFSFNGSLIAEQTLPPIEPGIPALGGIMRPKLHQIMSTAVRSLRTGLRLGVSAIAFDQTPDSVRPTNLECGWARLWVFWRERFDD